MEIIQKTIPVKRYIEVEDGVATVQKFVAFDGKEFDNKASCEIYEINAKVKQCERQWNEIPDVDSLMENRLARL